MDAGIAGTCTCEVPTSDEGTRDAPIAEPPLLEEARAVDAVEPCNPEPDGKPGPNGAAAEAFLPLVGAIARALRRGLPPTVELDELINDGVLGLFTALERYDPSRGVGFSTYAGHRIRGAMLDGLRQRDPLPRTYRRALKAAESAGIQFLELDHALTVPADEADGPEALVLEADLRDQVWRGLQALPSRDREVLELRMVRGLPLRAVAAHLCLSVTRIAEIQTRGVTRLRRFMAGEALAQPRRKGSLKSNEWGPAASQEGSENRAPLWKCL